MASQEEEKYDRLKALQQFDNSKSGVKGLLDSGLTTIPLFFVHPPDTLSDLSTTPPDDEVNAIIIPTIDLSSSSSSSSSRSSVVDQMAKAAREFGFFQVVNHGIPNDVMESVIGSIRGFHEQPAEVKSPYYGREMTSGFAYASNLDLYQSKAASWRDSIRVRVGPTFPNPDDFPEVCRNEIVEWDQHTKRLGVQLMEFLCEGLEGVNAKRLKEMKCSESRLLVGQYYPYCPEPDRTIGIMPHTDQGVITILAQDHIGGLQIKHDGKWLGVKPVPGALVVNIGDMLQIISNDEYKSVEHRAVANRFHEPRISVAVFFNLNDEDSICGPLPELISQDKPAVYRQFTLKEFRTRLFKLDGKPLRNHFKL
ncbi:hypothetical protein ACFE04_012999 [Oxalis oulophora]